MLLIEFIAVVLAPTAAPAQPSLQLDWSAPAECPQHEYVAAAFARYVGAEPATDVEAQAAVRAVDHGYQLELSVGGHLKSLDSESCDDLAEAAALILSIAATAPESLGVASAPVSEPSPSNPEAADEPAAEPAVSRDPPSSPRPVEPVRPVVAPPTIPNDSASLHPRGIRGSVRAEVGFRFGVMPSFGGDASLVVGMLWRAARIEVAGTWWTPRVATLDDDGDTRVLATLGSVEARGCWTPYVRRLEFPLCGGLELGAVRIDGRGAAPAATQHALWVGASVGAAVVWLGHPNLGLWFGPEAVIGLRRPRIEVAQTSYTVGPAAIRGLLGIEARFP